MVLNFTVVNHFIGCVGHGDVTLNSTQILTTIENNKNELSNKSFCGEDYAV